MPCGCGRARAARFSGRPAPARTCPRAAASVLLGLERRALPIDAQAHAVASSCESLAVRSGLSIDGEHLSLGHRVAGMHFERDGAERVRVQRRAYRRDHLAIRGDVAHEAAALHRGDAQSRAIDRSAGAGVSKQQTPSSTQMPTSGGDRHRRSLRWRRHRLGALDRSVLGRRVAQA